jgi:plastocyanin
MVMRSEQQYSPPRQEETPRTAGSVIIELIAKHKAFNLKTMTVAAGAHVTINFHNEDTITPHNFALYTDSSAQTEIYKGKTALVKKHLIYEFTAPSQPGTYFFRCDIHPTMMFGDFIVE